MPEAVQRTCPVCGGPPARTVLRKGELHLAECRNCRMVFANPAPAEMVSGAYYDEQGTAYYLSPEKLAADYSRVRFERELRVFTRHCSGGRVLDVGCSSGAFLFQLKQQFQARYELLGTDVSGAPLDYAESRGIQVARGDFLTLPLDGEFDAITFWAVLEHLLEPSAFLSRANKLLKPGGHCFALVPNMQSAAARILGAKYRYIYPQHLNYFRASTLRLLVERSGMDVVETRCTHWNPLVLWQDLSRPRSEVPNAERARLLSRTTNLKQARGMRMAKLAYNLCERMLGTAFLADNLVVVMRKPRG